MTGPTDAPLPDPLADPDAATDVRLVVHSLLLEFVGVLPDDLVVAVRRELAAGRLVPAVEGLTFGLRRAQPPVSDDERHALRLARHALRLDPSEFDDLPRAREPRRSGYRFDSGPDPDDPSTPEVWAAEREVVDRLTDLPGLLGVWVARRLPPTGASWPPERPVFVIEARDDATVLAVLERWYGPEAAVPAADGPLIEVYLTGDDLPDFHRQAQLRGTLEFCAGPAARLTLVPVFDVPAHSGQVTLVPRLDAGEAARLAERLDRGRLIGERGFPADDVLDPGRAGDVPGGVRTDGRWIWTDETTYYLREHAVPPPEPFLSFLRRDEADPPPVSDAVATVAQELWESEGPARPPIRGLEGGDVLAALHRLVLELEGLVPDSFAARVRRALAVKAAPVAAELLLTLADEVAVLLRTAERALLAECLDALGLDESAARARRQLAFDGSRPAPFELSPGDDEEGVPLTDVAVVAVLGRQRGVLGVWRAWRRPVEAEASGWDVARPVYAVECADDDAVGAVLAACWAPDASVPEPSGPLVLPYAGGDVLPDLLAGVVMTGRLVHVGVDLPRFDVVSVYGEGSETLASVPRLPADEAARLVARLAAGRVIERLDPVEASGLADDVIEPRRTGAAPLTMRTDGRWVWSDVTTYYLSRYGIPPEQDFLEALRAQTRPPVPVPDVVAALASRRLRLPEGVPVEAILPPPPVLPPLTRREVRLQLHRLLQSVLDLLPEATVDALFRSLAADLLEEAVADLARAMVRHAPVAPVEADMLDECAQALGVDLATVTPGPVPTTDGDRAPQARIESAPGEGGPEPGGPEPGGPEPGGPVAADLAVLSLLRQADGALGAWRAWWHPLRAEGGAPPRVLHVVEVRDVDALIALERALHGPGTPPSGPGGALVVTYVDGHHLPPLLQQVQTHGDLVHVGLVAPEFRLTPSPSVFGPGLTTPAAAGRPEQLSAVEADRVAGYLTAGRQFATLTGERRDVHDPAQARVLPAGVSTDGTWLWADELLHYVEEYLMAPPQPFLDHVRAQGGPPPRVSDTVATLALRWLLARTAP